MTTNEPRPFLGGALNMIRLHHKTIVNEACKTNGAAPNLNRATEAGTQGVRGIRLPKNSSAPRRPCNCSVGPEPPAAAKPAALAEIALARALALALDRVQNSATLDVLLHRAVILPAVGLHAGSQGIEVTADAELKDWLH